MLITTRHYQDQPVAAPGQVPDWVHLIPAGTFRGVDGRGPYSVPDAAALIRDSMADGHLPLDENHSTDTAALAGAPSPARGWIMELQARADGIWGRVEWNETGRQLMSERAYRGISPVFTADRKTGHVQKLLRAAMTNTPNLDLHPLHSQQETHLDLATIRAALKLPDEADEAAVMAAITAAHAASAELATVRQSQQAAAGEVQAMATRLVSMETELHTLRANTQRAAAVAFIDSAIAAGRPISALRDHYVARHMANPTDVEKEVNALPSIHAGGMPPQRHDMGDGDELTAEEMAVCKKMGQDPKKFAANKKKMAAKKGGM
jgi:phage I-like protein